MSKTQIPTVGKAPAILNKEEQARVDEAAAKLALAQKQISSKDLVERLRFFKNANINVMLLGPPGVGKSAMIKTASERDNDRWFYDVRLSLHDPTDIIGMPFTTDIVLPEGVQLPPGASKKAVDFSRPHFLPPLGWMQPGDTGTIFFDELNTAPIAVQNAALQPFCPAPNEPRRVGSHIIGENIWLVAAGNREQDGGHVNPMGMPLRDRFAIITIDRPDYHQWLKWAQDNGVHKDVMSFLGYKSSMLFVPAKDEYDVPATPRSWSQKASPLAAAGCRDAGLYQSVIGKAASVEFVAFLTELQQMPDPRKVLEGKVKWDWNQRQKLAINYALLIEFIEIVKEDPKKWIDRAMTQAAMTAPEHASIFVIGLLQMGNKDKSLFPIITQSDPVIEWTEKHKEFWIRIQN